MSFLEAAVALAGALCLLNLLLIFGVIRRLRQHTEMLGNGTVPDMPVTSLAAGDPVAAFSVRTLDGGLLTGASGLRVAGFFAVACSACPDRVDPFARYLTGHQVAPDSVLSIVVAPGESLPPYAHRLSEVGRVCAVRIDSEVIRAFKVAGFPAFCLLDADGAVVATGYDPARLPVPVAAA